MTANTHIQEQAEVLKMLESRGYLATFAVGIDEAMAIINWYLEPDGIYQNYIKPFPGKQYLKTKGITYESQR